MTYSRGHGLSLSLMAFLGLACLQPARALEFREVPFLQAYACQIRARLEPVSMRFETLRGRLAPVDEAVLADVRNLVGESARFHWLMETRSVMSRDYVDALSSMNQSALVLQAYLPTSSFIEPVADELTDVFAFLRRINERVPPPQPPAPKELYWRKREQLLERARYGSGIHGRKPGVDWIRIDEDGDIEDFDEDDDEVGPPDLDKERRRLDELDYGNDPGDDRFRIGKDGYLEDYDLDG